MTLLTHRARPEDVFDAVARLRSHVEGPAGRVEVDVTDLRMILDQIVWSAPDLHDPALDHLAYLRWVLERLDEDERRRCMAWLTDEYVQHMRLPVTPEVMWGLFAWLVGYAPTAWEYDLWRCEECRASWESGWHQCMRCGNRTREPAMGTGTIRTAQPTDR